MTTPRRPRGSLVDPVQLGYEVERSNKRRFDEIAQRAGISRAEFFDLMVENIDLDSQGLPVWLPAERRPVPFDGELPIDTA